MPRNELSKKSKYYLPKEEYLTVKHFCLQYPAWEAELDALPDAARALNSEDVANMMILFKVARNSANSKDDNWIDIAGYAACGGEVSGERADE